MVTLRELKVSPQKVLVALLVEYLIGAQVGILPSPKRQSFFPDADQIAQSLPYRSISEYLRVPLVVVITVPE